MTIPLVRKFALSAEKGRGVSCGENGTFIGSIPLLKRTSAAGEAKWQARDVAELSADLSAHFGLPIDFSSKALGLEAVAHALNKGDVTRAQFVVLHLQIPEPPKLTSNPPYDDSVQFVRDLHWGGLLKANFNPNQLRWPALAPDSQGGRFALEDGGAAQSAPVADRTIPSTTSHRTAPNKLPRLRPWSDLAGGKPPQLITGVPVPVGPLGLEAEESELIELFSARLGLKPGPYAEESIPSSGPRIRASERPEINRIGDKNGCHTRGTREPGTKSGNWIGDHQQPTRLNPPGKPQRLYPQCANCSARQGGAIQSLLRLRLLRRTNTYSKVARGKDAMIPLERSVAPPNSLIFIADPAHAYDVPVDTGAASVTFTSSCICVGTLMWQDGETTIRLGTVIQDPIGYLVFEGTLETPGRCVEVGDSGLDRILAMPVDNTVTHVKIWANDVREPDLIQIQVC